MGRINGRLSVLLLVLGAFGWAGICCAGAESPAQEKAGDILDKSGIRGGLVVHLGCGDGRVSAALHAGPGYLVHGLDADAAEVERARSHIRGEGLYGEVTAEHWTTDGLPYADRMVTRPSADQQAEGTPVRFGTLSVTGGIMNAYEAVRMAEERLQARR